MATGGQKGHGDPSSEEEEKSQGSPAPNDSSPDKEKIKLVDRVLRATANLLVGWRQWLRQRSGMPQEPLSPQSDLQFPFLEGNSELRHLMRLVKKELKKSAERSQADSSQYELSKVATTVEEKSEPVTEYLKDDFNESQRNQAIDLIRKMRNACVCPADVMDHISYVTDTPTPVVRPVYLERHAFDLKDKLDELLAKLLHLQQIKIAMGLQEEEESESTGSYNTDPNSEGRRDGDDEESSNSSDSVAVKKPRHDTGSEIGEQAGCEDQSMGAASCEHTSPSSNAPWYDRPLSTSENDVTRDPNAPLLDSSEDNCNMDNPPSLD